MASPEKEVIVVMAIDANKQAEHVLDNSKEKELTYYRCMYITNTLVNIDISANIRTQTDNQC